MIPKAIEKGFLKALTTDNMFIKAEFLALLYKCSPNGLMDIKKLIVKSHYNK